MVVLRELVLKDFKSFRNETITFGARGFTVFVGPNGSGKSSVLEAALYAAFSHFPALPAFPGLDFVRRGADGFDLKLSVDASHVVPGSTVVEMVNFDGHRRSITRWIERKGQPAICVFDELEPHKAVPLPSKLKGVQETVPYPRLFDVDLNKLRWPMRPGPRDAAVFQAEQVIQTIFDLKLGGDPSAFQRLITQLQTIVPAVKALAIERQEVGSTDQYGLVLDMSTGARLKASQVSEGTLLALALLTATELATGPTLLLIDDLDRALHPTAQRELVKLLRAVVSLGNIEVICTTHSPYILSEFDFDEVRVVKEIGGASRCMSLADGPEAGRWVKELDAGEYWSFMESRLLPKGA